MKAILVIDVDDNTDLEFYDVRVWCYNNTTGLHKWYQNVQLKPVPTQVIDRNTFAIENKYMNYQDGYNACIDEIFRE